MIFGEDAGRSLERGVVCESSAKNADGFGSVASGSVPEKPVASGWLTGLHRFMSLRWRAVSIFSKILIQAPVQSGCVLGRYSSGAKTANAEGEKGKLVI
jgi:hypothetical protein